MTDGVLAHDVSDGNGQLVILLPGAGDIRSENRFLAPALVAAGHRVVNADLPGHGESDVVTSYGVAETAAALVRLIDHVDSGPAVIVANSFAPTAAVWAAATDPDKVKAVIAISPHLEPDDSLQAKLLNRATSILMRGPWAARVWARLYRSWYKTRPPADLDGQIEQMTRLLADPERRRAVRETLTAHREGVASKVDTFDLPSLVVFGAADDHFADPAAEASHVASRLGGESLIVDGAGHYPQVEMPDVVGPAVVEFIERLEP